MFGFQNAFYKFKEAQDIDLLLFYKDTAQKKLNIKNVSCLILNMSIREMKPLLYKNLYSLSRQGTEF